MSSQQCSIAINATSNFLANGMNTLLGDEIFTCFFFVFCSDSSPLNLFYSTSPAMNKLNPKNLRVAVVQSAEQDDNRDGKIDRLELNFQMPLAPSESVLSASVLLYLDVQLSGKVRYQFDSLAFARFEGAVALSSVTIDGDLLVHQTWPLVAKGGCVFV